ncbi:unnamed protein product, partial [Polarella glacialis]
EHRFVVLGLGFATLVSPPMLSCIQVEDDLVDVRIAGLILDAGTPATSTFALPLLQWGSRVNHTSSPEDSPGVASDIFARIGSFAYLGCEPMRAGSMIEINANGVVLDNVWVWHADHDDCSGFDPGFHRGMAHYPFMSDQCRSKHGVAVHGHFITAYGLAVEHIVDGHLTWWTGEYGQAFFYQAELPYHKALPAGSVGYAVAPTVLYHLAVGLGVYMIVPTEVAAAGFFISPYSDLRNVITIVVGAKPTIFSSQVCFWLSKDKFDCFQPDSCENMRCWTATIPHIDPTSLPGLNHLGFRKPPGDASASLLGELPAGQVRAPAQQEIEVLLAMADQAAFALSSPSTAQPTQAGPLETRRKAYLNNINNNAVAYEKRASGSVGAVPHEKQASGSVGVLMVILCAMCPVPILCAAFMMLARNSPQVPLRLGASCSSAPAQESTAMLSAESPTSTPRPSA